MPTLVSLQPAARSAVTGTARRDQRAIPRNVRVIFELV